MKYKIECLRNVGVNEDGLIIYCSFSKYADGIIELKKILKDIRDSDGLFRIDRVYKIYKDFRHIDVSSKYRKWDGGVKC